MRRDQWNNWSPFWSSSTHRVEPGGGCDIDAGEGAEERPARVDLVRPGPQAHGEHRVARERVDGGLVGPRVTAVAVRHVDVVGCRCEKPADHGGCSGLAARGLKLTVATGNSFGGTMYRPRVRIHLGMRGIETKASVRATKIAATSPDSTSSRTPMNRRFCGGITCRASLTGNPATSSRSASTTPPRMYATRGL